MARFHAVFMRDGQQQAFGCDETITGGFGQFRCRFKQAHEITGGLRLGRGLTAHARQFMNDIINLVLGNPRITTCSADQTRCHALAVIQ